MVHAVADRTFFGLLRMAGALWNSAFNFSNRL